MSGGIFDGHSWERCSWHLVGGSQGYYSQGASQRLSCPSGAEIHMLPLVLDLFSTPLLAFFCLLISLPPSSTAGDPFLSQIHIFSLSHFCSSCPQCSCHCHYYWGHEVSLSVLSVLGVIKCGRGWEDAQCTPCECEAPPSLGLMAPCVPIV